MFTRSLVVLGIASCGRVNFADRAIDGGDTADVADTMTDVMASTLLVGCRLRFTFDEPSWNGGIVDGCGTHVGTPVGGATPMDDLARGRVADFAGGTSCVGVADAPELRGGAAFTSSAWVNAAITAPASAGIVAKRVDFGVDESYAMFLWDNGTGTNRLYTDFGGSSERFELAEDQPTASWHLYTVVFDGAREPLQRTSIYVDGLFRSFAPAVAAMIPSPTPAADVSIGCLPLSGPAQSLTGQIDDVTLWDRALSGAEVAAWYATTR